MIKNVFLCRCQCLMVVNVPMYNAAALASWDDRSSIPVSWFFPNSVPLSPPIAFLSPLYGHINSISIPLNITYNLLSV